ncbi:MAG: hypothetical protein HRT47_05500 [Candidatus Caenarcaniphilales bacterium]|nr:hypothetical protein [Candidatus Caenarcaniphilales bacterium]
MNQVAQKTNLAYAFNDFKNSLDNPPGVASDIPCRSETEIDKVNADTIADLSKVREFENEVDDSLQADGNPNAGFFVKKVLPNLHNLYGLSSVFSFIATPLGLMPNAKKAGDILQRVGYCLDTAAHQLRGVFTKGERVNLGMMVPTAVAFLGTLAFENKSFWGQWARNFGNLCHLGILKDMLDFAKEFPDTLPDGTADHIANLHNKDDGSSSNLIQDFINDWKVAFELTFESFKNPKILEATKDSLSGKQARNIPHLQAVSSVLIGAIGGGSLISKVLGQEKIAWALNKSLAVFPTFANIIRSKSYASMKDPDLVVAGKYGEVAGWGTLASAVMNFKFEDAAMAARSFFMGVNTMSFRKEAIKIFKAAADEIMNKPVNNESLAAA